MQNVEELNALRIEMINKCNQGTSALLRGIGGFLEALDIPSDLTPIGRNEIGITLSRWGNVIDLLEQYESQGTDASWCQQREIIEEFISMLIPDPYFPLVVRSDRVKCIGINMYHWIFELDSRKISAISHWCLCAHEAAHLPEVYPVEPIFAPDLTPSLDVQAGKLWSGGYDDEKPGWFMEILGDLWSCYQTGPAYLWGAVEYYPTANLDSGDLSHPPPNLRLAMMARLLVDHLDYPRNTIPPDIPSLSSILPNLGVDDPTVSREVNEHFDSLSNELFRPDLVDYVEQESRRLLNGVQNRKSEILQSYALMGRGEVLGDDIVADVSALATLCSVQAHTQDQLLAGIIEEYMTEE